MKELLDPEEAGKHIESLAVPYHDFDGERHMGEIEIATPLAHDLRLFFSEAYRMNFPFDAVVRANAPPFRGSDDKLMTANATSGFNPRRVAGSTRVSKHALGLAIDVNPMLNPYVSYRDGKREVSPPGAFWDPSQPGTLHKDHGLVHLMKGFGWEWGGDWTRADDGVTDYQHFEWQHDVGYSVRDRFWIAVHGLGHAIHSRVMPPHYSEIDDEVA